MLYVVSWLWLVACIQSPLAVCQFGVILTCKQFRAYVWQAQPSPYCRTCSTDEQRVARCHHLLAACANLSAIDLGQKCSGLAVAVDFVRSTLSELCTIGRDTASQALLLQPVIAKLCVLVMLHHKKGGSNQQNQLDINDLRQIGAETAVLAAEMRFLAEALAVDKLVALAAYDIQTLTGQALYYCIQAVSPRHVWQISM